MEQSFWEHNPYHTLGLRFSIYPPHTYHRLWWWHYHEPQVHSGHYRPPHYIPLSYLLPLEYRDHQAELALFAKHCMVGFTLVLPISTATGNRSSICSRKDLCWCGRLLRPSRRLGRLRPVGTLLRGRNQIRGMTNTADRIKFMMRLPHGSLIILFNA